jgi:type VI secretion system protein ImpA
LRFSPEWRQLAEARRADDKLPKGVWESEPKTTDWSQVLDLASKLLGEKSKDLRLAMFLVEAKVQTEGFRGLAEGLRFTDDLLRAFWDAGLHPLPEPLHDGIRSFEDRARALAWLNDKLSEVVSTIPITFAPVAESNYSFARYLSARKVGQERDYERETYEKREQFAAAKRAGLCLDLFDEAVKNSDGALCERLNHDVESAIKELANLQATVNNKFGDPESAPGFSDLQNPLQEIGLLVGEFLTKKGINSTPAGKVSAEATPLTSVTSASPIARLDGFAISGSSSPSSDLGSSWAEAEALVLSGQIDRGLAKMALLAQRETSGRNRYQRKLLLAQVCLKNRPRFARTILEELAEQIDKYKLEEWETTDVVGGVWASLYRLYLESDEIEKAAKLYGRLCRLDPWQTLSCTEE